MLYVTLDLTSSVVRDADSERLRCLYDRRGGLQHEALRHDRVVVHRGRSVGAHRSAALVVMTLRVFAQVVLAVEGLAALPTQLHLLARVDDKVARQVLVALEGLGARGTRVGPSVRVRHLVTVEVFLARVSRPAHPTHPRPVLPHTQHLNQH